MHFWDLIFQIITVLLFAVFLTLAVLFYQERESTYFFLMLFLAWTSAGGVITLLLRQYLVLEQDLSGWLVPANDPLPEDPCQSEDLSIPANAIRIYFGGTLGYTTKFPFNALKIGEEPFLTIKKVNDALSISTKIYSRDHRIIAEIVDNEFHINPNNYFRKTRPDNYTLIVYDQQGRVVLNVRYMNTRAIKVLGILNSPGHPEIILREREIRIGRHILRSNCIGDLTNGYAIQ